MEIEPRKSFLPKLAFELFKKADISFKEKGSLPDEILETLHVYFDDAFIQATELLERSRVTCFSTPDNFQKIYEVSTAAERYALFEDVNFCPCNYFKNRVLNVRNSLSCKHVLVVYLARIVGKIRREQLTPNVYEEYLNMQFNNLLDVDSQEG